MIRMVHIYLYFVFYIKFQIYNLFYVGHGIIVYVNVNNNKTMSC